jgi:hypothetical protein
MRALAGDCNAVTVNVRGQRFSLAPPCRLIAMSWSVLGAAITSSICGENKMRTFKLRVNP